MNRSERENGELVVLLLINMQISDLLRALIVEWAKDYEWDRFQIVRKQ